jgi:hypothetical protein
MATEPKKGPFTIDELLQVWLSSVDEQYSRPFLERLDPGVSIDAGEDGAPAVNEPNRGLEVFTSQMAVAKRVSEAVVRTTESMFILPHSGQEADPASGPELAEVELTFERTGNFTSTITLREGEIICEEIMRLPGKDAAQLIPSGRRYVLAERLTFVPGEPGPKSVLAVSVKPGFGYNNPDPDSITTIVQPGSRLQNTAASVIVSATDQRLRVTENPDVVVPEHTGQYIQLTAGANQGKIARMVAYTAPDPSLLSGGEATLARTAVLRVSGVVGTFLLDEEVEQATTGARALYSHLGGIYLVLERADSTFAATFVITGLVSGATATVDAIEQPPELIAEAATADWVVLDWVEDFKLTVTNEQSPEGGRAGMLDQLGSERRIERAEGESDDSYRKRVAALPDTISPNAIRRAANRVLSQIGHSGCLRESSLPLRPGIYCDRSALDIDTVVDPSKQFQTLLDYEQFRAFFLIGVPPLNLGEFGIAYDVGEFSAYDASPFLAFHDGFPVTAAVFYLQVWRAIEKARAAGVGFDLVIDRVGCG